MDIILYSTGCPKCKVLETKLNSKNIKYNLIDDEGLMVEKGFMSAPMLEVDGKIMNFVDANNWINEQGE